MGLFLGITDLDGAFNSSTRTPIIVNDMDVNSNEDKERFNELISTRYDGDTLSTTPECACGNPELSKEYYIGRVCSICNTPVAHVTEREIEPSSWIKAPQGVKALINPIIWTQLSNHFTTGGVNLIEWLCNPLYKPTRSNKLLNKLMSFGFKRGLNNFITNFDEIMNALFEAKLYSNSTKGRIVYLQILLTNNRDKLFPKYLPIPSKMAFITENTVAGVYADPTMAPAIDAVRTISSIKTALRPLNQRQLENRALKAIIQLATYYEDTHTEVLGKKEGWFRKHIFGSRCHMTARCVITSLSEVHAYDELHIPWPVAVVIFRLHLINKLIKRGGWNPSSAVKLLNSHTKIYHPLIDELFDELIAEGMHKTVDGRNSIPVLFNRN